MRTKHNLGTPVLVRDSWVAHDRTIRAQTWERLSVSFEQIFVSILICFHFDYLPLWAFGDSYSCYFCVCSNFCFFVVRVWWLFVVWLWCYLLVCPWLCSIDPRFAVLCHGWHRGVALCWRGETYLPWFKSSSLLSLSLFLSLLSSVLFFFDSTFSPSISYLTAHLT